ncbi:adenine-specific methyltransferase EcoRI family protein [Fibrobacter sp.]|uniref:adenine-specific methyltransferase EcoRI family protein n=1 Tax=Fibrobacter sp. TaxID=35828 RepID=UPI00386A7194
MANKALSKAKDTKNDEFYTIYADIEKEMNAYLEYDEDVFRNKTILLPCDDPEWSNFTRYFAQNFEKLGLKKLISTSYAIESKKYKVKDWQPTLFEQQAPWFDVDKSKIKGKIFTLDHDTNRNGRIDIEDLEWKYLEGDGDFCSDEIKRLRDEADYIITNPPFSLFRDFMAWIMESKKKFAVIGNMNAITYKEVFPLLMANKVWMGATGFMSDMVFAVPKGAVVAAKDREKAAKLGYVGDYTRLGNSCWFTNIEHGRRHQPLSLMTEADNIKFSKHKDVKGVGYKKYDNYNAIHIPWVDSIPCDFNGVMGVPISFMGKYCPEQFEILGATQRGCHDAVPDTKKYDDYWEMKPNGKPTGSSGGKTNENANLVQNDGKKNYFVNKNGRIIQSAYQRIFVKFKK